MLGEAAASSQPGEGSLHDPAPGQHDKALGPIAAPDDLHIDAGDGRFQPRLERRALIAAIGIEREQERVEPEQRGHHHDAAVTILNVSGMDECVHQEALRVDQNVPLLALDLLSRIVAVRIVAPPFSALLTLWLSMMAAVGEASRSACRRQLT